MSVSNKVETKNIVPKAKTKDTAYFLHCVVVLALMFGFKYIPPVAPITHLGMNLLGIFFGLLYAWTFVDMIWPSLLGIIAVGLSGFITVTAAFQDGFGNSVTLLILFALVFAVYLDSTGLTTTIAHWFISRRISIGRPYVFSLMIFLAGFVLGSFISIIACTLILWIIFYKVATELGYKPGEKYVSAMLVGIAYSCMLGGSFLPWKPLPAIILGNMNKLTGLTVSFGSFTIVGLIISILGILAYLAVMKFIIRPDVAPLQKGEDFFAEFRDEKITYQQKIGIAALGTFILMLLLPGVLPMTTPGIKQLANIGMTGSIAIVLLILVAVRIKGKPLMDFAKMANTNMNWQIIILLAASIPIANGLGAKDSGIMAFVAQNFGHYIAGLSPMMLIVSVTIVASVLTQFAHNLVAAAIMTPLMCQFAIQLGINPLVIAPFLNLALSAAIATPGASTPGALVFGNREWIPVKHAYLYNFYAFLMTLIIMVIVAIVRSMML
ncbi:hypothetical protein E4K67_16195 [Desulfosporosinus fructosivorans]|uniref:Citrate transporter-like domain-containing protein n=1 Tax=Desulfosporosinus fructosivorans TaxID=2018669 RepID=A0A4Z0R494_9FIRM|nr:SLC13 family permease [Desulfosporosinus fructosivorans]TGE37374.1 hypothetical protein E4K67_16195 [Desulfosporosinus fructosivorans]